MNRQERRALAAMADRENRAQPASLAPVHRSTWPSQPPGLSEVWRSAGLLVQVYEVPGEPEMRRLTVQRTTDAAFRRKPGAGHATERPLSWDELQQVKRDVGRGEQTAIELYPPDEELIADAPMRHLWILPAAPPWAWRRT